MADQLRHRRQNLAERDHVQTTKNELVRWNESRIVVRKRLDELEAIVDRLESESAEIDTHRTRLQGQLKTVIAPREAEALQSEIANLTERRGELDERELEALEEQTRLDDELAALNDQEEALRNEFLAADAALGEVTADVDAELARVEERLADLRAAVDKKVLRRYDALRKKNVIAAATLAGSRCEGCHLDLSAAEVDAVKDAAEGDGIADCPQCGRLIVV